MEASVQSQPKSAPFGALALARTAAAGSYRRLLAWQMARTALRLGFAASTAMLVGRLVMDGAVLDGAAWAAAACLALAALAGLAADRVQATAETAAADAVRKAARARLENMPAGRLAALSVGALAVSMQRHPQALATLVTGHRAAATMMAAGPLAGAAALFVVSWQAALTVLALTPVMIVFFVLVGETIRRRALAQERAFGRLAGQFADRVRTLPTILANHALAGEAAKLETRLGAYADRTMGVLRIAFLNAAVIDFFASLSIAMLAVFLGLGHLKLAMIPGFSDLALWQSLFILMIAPEYFAPFRRYAEQYHAKAEGLAAADALDALMAAEGPAAPALPAVDRALARTALPPRGLLAVTGPSGSGKSTLLRRIAGVDGQPQTGASWISTDCFVPEGSLAEAIRWRRPGTPMERARQAARTIGLLDDRALPGGMEAGIAAGGENLSGGQRLRIAVARALVADGPVFADEPTAKLDHATARRVRAALAEMAATRPVVVATHDRELAALAAATIELAPAVLEDAA